MTAVWAAFRESSASSDWATVGTTVAVLAFFGLMFWAVTR